MPFRNTPSEVASESLVRDLLRDVFGRSIAGDDAFTADGMAFSELVVLYDLVSSSRCTRALEIGMANGTSSVVISAAMHAAGGGSLTSIDPYQTTAYASRGVEHVTRAGFAQDHHLVTEASYAALPKLLAEGHRFDFVFIDGWHSFDYVMIDTFFSDLLLEDGGVIAFHDTQTPAVFRVLEFLERHRPYGRLSPPPLPAIRNVPVRAWRRLTLLTGAAEQRRQVRDRRDRWRTLSAYRKLRTEITPEQLSPES